MLTCTLAEIVHKFPNGYPRLAAYQASDESFMQVRKFRRLAFRTLLPQQTNITRLEKELDALDAEYARDNIKKKILRGWDSDAGEWPKPNMKEEETETNFRRRQRNTSEDNEGNKECFSRVWYVG
jgi:hypothetical protein